MKIKVVMLYDEGRAMLGDISAPLAQAYALKHGYEFVCYRSLFNPKQPASWNKITAVRSQMDDCDWLLWLDADALLLRDDLKIEDVVKTFSWNKPLLISLDKWGVCFGVFLIKNCAWSKALFEMLPHLGSIVPADPFDTHDTWEQNAIKCLMHFFPDFRSKISFIPEWMICNQDSNFWPDAWMIHYWAALNPVGLEGLRQRMLTCVREGWSTKVHKV